MKKFMKKFFVNLSVLMIFIISPVVAFAQNSQVDQYMTGKVVEVFYAVDDEGGQFQEVTVEVTSGEEKGNLVYVDHGLRATLLESEILHFSDKVMLLKTAPLSDDGGVPMPVYYISDYYRIPAMIWVLGFFALLTFIFARKKGLSALIGLAFSILILIKFMVPQILLGGNPFLITFAGALFVMLVSMYLAHGFHSRTTVAFLSTLITILLALILSVIFTDFVNIFGTGSQDAYSLQFLDDGTMLNLKGLFLGGIIIGTLGILDDITVSQAAIVDELKKANAKLTAKELYTHAISVGREHIASLVNTLVLAYAGPSLPIFIMFTINKQSTISLINSEFVAEEVIRTLIGSSALILAVPITTLIAAAYFSRYPSDPQEESIHVCGHSMS